MFSAVQRTLLTEVLNHLTGAVPMPPERSKQVTAALAAALLEDAKAAESISRRRTKNQGRGRPTLIYTVEMDPGWRGHANGVEQAVSMVNEELLRYGRRAVNGNAVRTAISRNGAWTTLLETDNGTCSLSIAKSRSQESGEAETADTAP